ncbi:MAG: lysostaphin resistance A-like protein [Woeseiaceae bacterium]
MQPDSRPDFPVSVPAIVVFEVAALFARSALETSLIRDGSEPRLAQHLSYLVVPPILLVLLCPYLARCKDSLRSLLRPADWTARVVLCSILLGLTLRITYWAVLTVLMWLGLVGTRDPKAIVGPLIGFDCPSPPVLLLSFAVMAVLTPVTEEVINRGFFLHALMPRGTTLALLLSAALFAVMHDPGSYPATFAIGLLLGTQMLNYRTLWAPILTHATYNAAAIVDWDCFRFVWNPPASDPGLAVAAGLAAPLALAGIVAALFLASEKAARAP